MHVDSIMQTDPEKYHGNLFLYTESGRIHLVEHYINGEMDTTETIRIFEKLIVQYQKEIPNDLDLAKTANDLAYLYRNQQNYELAEKYYLLAKDIRKSNLGKDNILYARSCAKLAWVYLKKSNYEDAELLFNDALKVYEVQLGTDHDRYRVVRDHLITIYRDTEQIEKLKKLQN